MNHFRIFTFTFLLISICSYSYSNGGLAESMIIDFSDTMEKVFKEKNIQALSNLLGENARIVIEVHKDQDTKSLELNKQEYLEYIEYGWEGTGTYESTTLERKIDISQDKQSATVIEKFIESGEYNGKPVSSTTISTWTLKMVSGIQLLQTSYNITKI